MPIKILLLSSLFAISTARLGQNFISYVEDRLTKASADEYKQFKEVVLGIPEGAKPLKIHHFSRSDLEDASHKVEKFTVTLKEGEINVEKTEGPLDQNLLSFGGRQDDKVKYGQNRPVILAHGLGSYAGQMNNVRKALLELGYKDHEIFGVFYGEPDSVLPNGPLACLYVRTLRKMIEYVHAYTKDHWEGDKEHKIDIIGFSMGVLMTRKAILGGKCVDDPSIDLGPPLTHMIHTYIGVSGPTNGSYLCTVGKDVLKTSIAKRLSNACSKEIGFYRNSTFIKDINLVDPTGDKRTPRVQHGYEATKYRFSLTSFEYDEVVGYKKVGGTAFEGAESIQDNEKKPNGHEILLHKRASFVAKMLKHPDVVQEACKSPKLTNDTSNFSAESMQPPPYTKIATVINKLKEVNGP
ncbi:lipase (class 2) domain-containing protein [Ditylenchus destructor]|uniref:Lipase (Class 2) domain-containing protein n=1 Tax=Ditylenchus destructor TaxID=166010 RepID=A0AAD4MU58_9BILA|nr:lipase (class 2) domain-containing protein [Ditylenchus destructor]